MDVAQTPLPRSPEVELSGKQRRHLRALAHHILPCVQIGRQGVNDAVARAVVRALLDHELIKIRVSEAAPVTAIEAGEQLAASTGAHVAGKIGRIVILYRRHETDPHVPLPD